MKSFKGYLLTEAVTKAAKQMEYALVDAAGGKSGKKSYPDLVAKAKKWFNLEAKAKITKATSETVVAFAKAILDSTEGNWWKSGTNQMAKNKYDINTKEWTGTNRTPKTDIIIGGRKVSLKTGSSQLMSGGPEESLSTFNAAARASGIKIEGLALEIEKGINGLMRSSENELRTNKQMGGLGVQKKGGWIYHDTEKGKKTEKDGNPGEDQIKVPAEFGGDEKGKVEPNTLNKDKFLKAADDFNKELKIKFKNLFDENTNFKKEFVFEAMTGTVKFGGNQGTANSFLVANYKGTGKYHTVEKSSDPYVASILSKVNPDVKFKSTAEKVSKKKTGFYRFWSVVGLGYNAAERHIRRRHLKTIL